MGRVATLQGNSEQIAIPLHRALWTLTTSADGNAVGLNEMGLLKNQGVLSPDKATVIARAGFEPFDARV